MGGIPSANFEVRNLADLAGRYQVVHEFEHEGAPWLVAQFAAPYVRGYEFWVVNDRGFLWEGVDSLPQALQYIENGCE